MDFSWRDHLTVHASGPIEEGDAAKFAAKHFSASLPYSLEVAMGCTLPH
jgi:hypothetical protein